MKRSIRVKLGDYADPIGTLYYDRQGARESAAFEYTSSWLQAPERFALEPQLPLVRGPQYHRKNGDGSIFHLSLADTEPDGWGRRVILREYARRRKTPSNNPAKQSNEPLGDLDFLLGVDDFARVGALRFCDEEGRFLAAEPDGGHRTPPLVELGALGSATRAVELNNESATDLAYLLGRGTSLGGMRPKCSILDSDGTLAIGKFPSVNDERSITKGEVLALKLAARSGIQAAQARLVTVDDTSIAVIRRFDRTVEGKRLMYVSAATLLGVEDPTEEHSYTEIVDIIRQFGFQTQKDIEELWRRIAFSILITNVDDHLHNHGFLYHGSGHWRLSPAFDINPFPERRRELKIWLSEQAGPDATIAGLMSVLPYFRISEQKAKEILHGIHSSISEWRLLGNDIGMSKPEIEMFEDAFEHKEKDALKGLLSDS